MKNLSVRRCIEPERRQPDTGPHGRCQAAAKPTRSVRIVDAAGGPLTDQVLRATCPTLGQGGEGPAGPVPEAVRQRMHECVARIGADYHEVVTYQPGDRYWTFQWWELAVFALVTALLCGYAWHRLRRFRG